MRNACACSTAGRGAGDVVASGVRPGSLDQHITRERPNDIAALLERFPGIRTVCCNGTASYKYLKRYFPELFLRESPASSRCRPPVRRRRG